MAYKSRSTIATAILVLVGIIVSMAVLTASQERISPYSAGLWGLNPRSRMKFPVMRRFDCSAICRKTGYSGYIGGCQCGFTLFTRKRANDITDQSDQSIIPPSDESNSISYAMNSIDESMANISPDDGNSHENLHHSAPQSSFVPSVTNQQQKIPCVGLCDQSK